MAIGIRLSLLFLVTLLTAFVAVLPVFCTGSPTGSGYEASLSLPVPDVGSDEYVPWSFAVITDLHVGREYGDYDGPGYNDSGTPISGTAAEYAQAAVNEINKIAASQGIAFVAVLGDMTETAEASQLRAAKQILDNLTVPWIPIMGNHDSWPHTDSEVAPACCPPPESYFDSIMGPQYSRLATQLSGWGEESPNVTWDPEVSRNTYFQNFFFDYGGFHFVCLDFNSRLGYAAGELHDFPGGTWSWFREHMEQFVQLDPEGSRDVIVLAHHPMRDDGDSSDRLNFSASELAQFSNFTNDTYYTYVDSSGNAQSRPYSSRIWGQFAGHRHPWALRVDYPDWSDGGPVITYPRNFGEVRIGLVKVTSDTPAGVDFSDPTVTTQAVTNMSLVSATLNGYLANLGTSSSVEVSFEWGTTTDYGFETPPQSMLGPGSFSFDLAGLTEETTYHFRARATGDGTSLGSDMAFTVSAMPPVVTTSNASGLTGTSANLNGYLAALGTATSVNVSFEWGLSTAYGNITAAQARTATGTFSASLSGLTVSTLYHFRARGDGDGTTYGSDVTFITDSVSAPAVATSPASGIATTSARLNGNLSSLGTAAGVTAYFEWGTTSGSYSQTTGSRTLTATGPFSEELTGLTPGTSYYYRARADGDGSDEGDEMRFTTAIVRPSVTTADASDVAATTATLNGDLTALGTADSVVLSFEWGTAPGSHPQATDTQRRSTSGAFSDALTGLTPGATYFYRAKADGDGDPVYGLEMSFTTPVLPPSVATTGATNLTTSSVTLNGELVALGTAASVTVSFEWGTASESYTEIAGSQMLHATGGFSHELAGLVPGTTYYYRATATGHGSPVHGLEESFTAALAPPLVTTSPASGLGATAATLNGELAALGTAASVAVSFEWGTAAGWYTQRTDAQTLTAAGAFSHDLDGLAPGTTYFYRARADGHGHPVYGSESSLATAIMPPSVLTDRATGLTTNSARLHGELVALGTAASVTVSFEWGTASESYTEIAGSRTLTATGEFSHELRGLAPGITYYCRARASGHGDPVYGPEMSFTTSTMPPVVITMPASNVATTAATLNAQLVAPGTGGSTVVSFEWGTTAGYGHETAPASVSAAGAFGATLTGLQGQTTYYFRARALCDGVAVYGEDMTFATAGVEDTTAPAISLVSATEIGSSGVTVTWATDEAATSLVEFGLTEEYGSSTAQSTGAVTNHSVRLTGLKSGTTYHFRVISRDGSGNQEASADGTFTTAGERAGMPAWAWISISLAVGAGVLGGTAYTVSARAASLKRLRIR